MDNHRIEVGEVMSSRVLGTEELYVRVSCECGTWSADVVRPGAPPSTSHRARQRFEEGLIRDAWELGEEHRQGALGWHYHPQPRLRGVPGGNDHRPEVPQLIDTAVLGKRAFQVIKGGKDTPPPRPGPTRPAS